jgi:hypothetical protein
MGEKQAVRKPIAAFNMVDYELEHPRFYPRAICDDGSVWEWNGNDWEELDPIPGTEADK